MPAAPSIPAPGKAPAPGGKALSPGPAPAPAPGPVPGERSPPAPSQLLAPAALLGPAPGPAGGGAVTVSAALQLEGRGLWPFSPAQRGALKEVVLAALTAELGARQHQPLPTNDFTVGNATVRAVAATTDLMRLQDQVMISNS